MKASKGKQSVGRLRAARESLGLRVKDLGDLAGIPASTVSTIERGLRDPKSETRAANVLVALGVRP